MDESILNEIKDLKRQVEELVTDDKGEAAVIDALNMFPALVGVWPMSTIGTSSQRSGVPNAVGTQIPLTNNNTVSFGGDGSVPFAEFDGSSNYLSHVDDSRLDITGTEAFIDSSIRGLTFGAWVYTDDNTAGFFISKGGGSPNRAYDLLFTGGVCRFQVSTDGSAVVTADTGTIIQQQWTFLAGVFIPSTSLTVWENDTTTTNTSSIPASIYNSSGAFNIGARAGGNFFDGRISLPFLCSGVVSDAQIRSFFELSRPLFGV